MKDGINVLKAFLNFRFRFRPGEDNFAVDEDQKDDARLDHPVNKAREQFGLVG